MYVAAKLQRQVSTLPYAWSEVRRWTVDAGSNLRPDASGSELADLVTSGQVECLEVQGVGEWTNNRFVRDALMTWPRSGRLILDGMEFRMSDELDRALARLVIILVRTDECGTE